MTTTYSYGRPSSRHRDLVDIVLLATTQAMPVARAVFDPILSGRTTGVWQPEHLTWSDG